MNNLNVNLNFNANLDVNNCYPDFTEFADVIDSAGGVHNVVFITTLKEPEVVGKIDALLSFGKEMNRIKVKWELRVDNHLHGKVYIFKKDGLPFAGIITSANLTHNGIVANHRMGMLGRRRANACIYREAGI